MACRGRPILYFILIEDDHSRKYLYAKIVEQDTTDVNLDDVFCLRERRTVNRDNTFKFDGKVYQITKRTVSRSNWYKAEIDLHIIPGRKIRIFHRDQFIQEFPLNEEKKLANKGKVGYKDEGGDILPEQ